MNSGPLLLYVSLFGLFSCFGLERDPPVEQYEVSDDLGLGRRFDGIGGLSGGGATSKLLVNYPEPQRSQILDYLFKPNFGASLHILKVEIGGDDQSTDGTESSHMHEEWDENYNRGYEWWLMKEAKKRNPDIKLWGLSWAWPGWIGEGTGTPYKNLTKTSTYTVKWIQGAKTHHNLTIDLIGSTLSWFWYNSSTIQGSLLPVKNNVGCWTVKNFHSKPAPPPACKLYIRQKFLEWNIWNEKQCDYNYIVELRNALNRNNLQNVKIVACDGWIGDLFNIMKNQTVVDAVYAFGVHYPGTVIPKQAIDTNYTIWASEDYSTYDDTVGAGCWARILNKNYVTGYMTSTTAWNLIASYYKGLPFPYTALMNAVEPWSGFYELKYPIWITAHTTQFTKIGYRYLQHERGVGLLKYGGSYVSLVSKERKNLTIVIETMTHDHSVCIRPSLPPYNVQPQKAIFKFGGTFAQLTQMHLWRTTMNFSDPSKSVIFKYEGKVEVVEGRLALNLDVDSVYTLALANIAKKGDHGPVPSSKPFPLPYFDDFQKYQINEEPYLLTPQIGVWEVYGEQNGNQFTRQVVQSQPISWCDQKNRFPIAVIGDSIWTDVTVSAKVRIPSVNGTSHVFVALRVAKGGCDAGSTTGYFFWLTPNMASYAVTADLGGTNVVDFGLLNSNSTFSYDKWYNVTVSIKNNTFTATVDNVLASAFFISKQKSISNGFVGVGTGGWGHADYDDLKITK